jgi:hypothetical protein
MSHQIYYTSAPEGLKRGSSGFCTVAASDNIPRALWDRLEALSAYRHHFPASAASQNPVSHAHWLLSVAGTSYHVLSRICDSGVDHTQRTNAFAHHLVLDPAEMAPAGPAWMLQRPGIMAESWDNRVGAIPPRNLPKADAQSAICREWERITGDAGWGGHLADIFIKSPTKPVCILFAPGQHLLPLLAETIALLPHAARWNVTFNTYFTSMPTSATCAWRCCLANTPAAQIGLRYAASGIVLDLTDRNRLGKVPDGPYVTLARTGLPPAGLLRPAAAPARPAVKTAAPARTQTAEKLDTLAEISEDSGVYDLADENNAPEIPDDIPVAGPSLPAPAPARPPVIKGAPLNLRKSDAALRQAETNRSDAAARHRKQVMLLFGSALGALAIGTLLIVILNNRKPPTIEPTLTTRSTAETPSPPPPPVYIAPAPDNQDPVKPVAPPPTTSSPAQAIVVPDPTPENPGTVTTPPTVVTPAAPKFPEVVTLTTALEYPTPGTGIADRTQTLKFRAADLDSTATTLRFLLPNGSINSSTDVPRGLLHVVAPRSSSGAATLEWKAQGRSLPHGITEIATITLDRRDGTVQVEWRSAAMQKVPDVVCAAYWALQSSWYEVHSGTSRQRIVFKPVDEPVLKLADASSPLFKGVEIPLDTYVALPAGLPPGWQTSWYTEWDVKDAALKNPRNASQVLKFHKPGTTAAVESWFLLTFRPGFTKVESTFARRLAADEVDLAKYESDLRAMTADIEQYIKNGKSENDLKPYREKKDEIQRLVDAYKAAVAGYKELTEFDVKLESPGGLRLTTLHFHAATK